MAEMTTKLKPLWTTQAEFTKRGWVHNLDHVRLLTNEHVAVYGRGSKSMTVSVRDGAIKAELTLPFWTATQKAASCASLLVTDEDFDLKRYNIEDGSESGSIRLPFVSLYPLSVCFGSSDAIAMVAGQVLVAKEAEEPTLQNCIVRCDFDDGCCEPLDVSPCDGSKLSKYVKIFAGLPDDTFLVSPLFGSNDIGGNDVICPPGLWRIDSHGNVLNTYKDTITTGVVSVTVIDAGRAIVLPYDAKGNDTTGIAHILDLDTGHLLETFSTLHPSTDGTGSTKCFAVFPNNHIAIGLPIGVVVLGDVPAGDEKRPITCFVKTDHAVENVVTCGPDGFTLLVHAMYLQAFRYTPHLPV